MRKFVIALSLAWVVALPMMVGCAKKETEAPKTEQAPAPAAPEGQAPASGTPADTTPAAGGEVPAEQPAAPAAK